MHFDVVFENMPVNVGIDRHTVVMGKFHVTPRIAPHVVAESLTLQESSVKASKS